MITETQIAKLTRKREAAQLTLDRAVYAEKQLQAQWDRENPTPEPELGKLDTLVTIWYDWVMLTLGFMGRIGLFAVRALGLFTVAYLSIISVLWISFVLNGFSVNYFELLYGCTAVIFFGMRP